MAETRVSEDLGPQVDRPSPTPVGRNRPPSKVWLNPPAFPDAARVALRDSQLRHNLAHATTVIRDKRARVVAELGGNENSQRATLHVRTSLWNKTAYDPYNNMLRTTVEGTTRPY